MNSTKKKNFNFNSVKVETYFNPIHELDDINILKIHRAMIKINIESGLNINNNYLNSKLTLDEIKFYLNNMIISFLYIGENLKGFLASPILIKNKIKILHLGLMIIHKNPGVNLLGFIGCQHIKYAYEQLGNVYITNISAAPSSVENFDSIFFYSWPSPRHSLKKPPKDFKTVLTILKEKYLDIYFPDTANVNIDQKRFVMKSNSKKMGFKTNMHSLSLASKFTYNSFCYTWLNYEAEEDMIQVAQIGFFNYLFISIITFLTTLDFLFTLKKTKSKDSFEKSTSIENENEKAA